MDNNRTICGADCSKCAFLKKCAGCKESGGTPFGGTCVAAEYIKLGGKEAFESFKKQLIDEFNSLHIEGMPKIDELYCLCGRFINMEYPVGSGQTVRLLDDKKIYLGTQVQHIGIDRCFGLAADMSFLLVCEYGENGTAPELLLYKKR